MSIHRPVFFFKDDLDENSKNLARTKCRPGVELPTNCNYQRRRSRAVLYHLSGQFDKHNRAKSKLQQLNKVHCTRQTPNRKGRYLFLKVQLNVPCFKFRSYNAYYDEIKVLEMLFWFYIFFHFQLTGSISGKMPEYKVQEVKKSKYVIAHYGIFKIGWDWLILLCTFYTAIMVPYNAAFTDMESDNSKSSLYSDIVVEIMFIIGRFNLSQFSLKSLFIYLVRYYRMCIIK